MTPPTPRPPADAQRPAAADDALHLLADRFGPEVERAVALLDDTTERARAFVRANPGAVLLGAALVGFAVGRWASRR